MTRTSAPLALLVVVFSTLVALDLLLGQGVGAAGMLRAVTEPDSAERRILWLTRAPRVATAVLAGLALGAAGHLLQCTLRNPLASPDLVGVTPPAILAVVGAVSLGWVGADDPAGVPAVAVAGGLVGGAVTVAAARRRAEAALVAGVLTGALGSGATVLLLALRPDRSGGVLRWLIGSVDGHVWPTLVVAAPVVGVSLAAAAVLGAVLPLLACGSEHAAGVGCEARLVRPAVLATVVLAAATAAALAGAVAFVGLVAGRVALALTGLDRRRSLPAAALAGAALLVGCDAAAQVVTLALGGLGSRAGVPAGAVAAVVGALVLVRLVRRRRVSA